MLYLSHEIMEANPCYDDAYHKKHNKKNNTATQNKIVPNLE